MQLSSTLRTICVFATLAIATPSLAADRQIQITGTGSIAAAPDMATITLGVVTQGISGKDALRANSEQLNKVFTDLAEAGIKKRDVQTSGLSLQPNWDRNADRNQQPVIVGYTARNGVTVRVRDLEILGDVLDDVVSSGANQFNGLTFGISNPKPLQNKARVAAVKDAQARATLLVTTAGATLGKVLNISESGGNRAPVMRAMAMDRAESSVPVAAGEVGVQATVTVTYEIID